MMTNTALKWPDPLDALAYYGLAGEIVRTIEPHSEADPVALLVQCLTGFGNVIGRGPHFTVEANAHSLNLFNVLVGATSKSRKGSSWGHILRLLKAVDAKWSKDCVASGLSSGEGLIWGVRDPIYNKGKLIDGGIDDKRLLVLEPEFASTLRVMGRDGSTLSPVIRQAWDNGDLCTLTKNSQAKVTGGHISIIGHITRDELRRYLNSTEAGNGFGNRYLWVCVKRSKCLPEGGRLQDDALTPLIQRLAEAKVFAETVGQMTRDDDARALWKEVYFKLSQEQPALLGALTSRAEAQVTRLSCLYALLDLSLVVKAIHLRVALALWKYCESSVRYIFGNNLGDPVADEILRALLAKPMLGLTRTNIRDLFERNKRVDEIAPALVLLLQQGLARMIIEHTGGRPSERWFAVTSDTTETTETI